MAIRSTRPPLFERLKQGLEESIAFCQGEISLRTVAIPEGPPPVTAQEIVALRKVIEVSQGVMARVLNVSPRTVQSWEQGTRSPSQASLRLLQILKQRPDVVSEVVGLDAKRNRRKQKSRNGTRSTVRGSRS